MSCRQSLEIELVDFLAEPRRDAFAAFRAHYPRCAECAAEVRAWTELQGLLGGEGVATHPEPELLARFDAAPAAVPAAERTRVESHLERCAACRDELRALAHFASATHLASEPRAAATRAPTRGRLSAWLAGIGRFAWNPAFAYALVGLLLLPVFAELRRSGSLAPPIPELEAPTPRSEGFALPEPKPAEPDAGMARLRPAVPTRPAPPPAEFGKRAASVQRQGRADLAEEPAAAADSEGGVGYDFAVPTRPAPSPAMSMAAPERLTVAPERSMSAPESSMVAPERSMVGTTPRPLLLAAERPLELDARAAEAALPLRLALSRQAVAVDAEVIVFSGDGRRELRERMSLPPAATWAEITIPAGWLAAGRHRIELRCAGTVEVYELVVP